MSQQNQQAGPSLKDYAVAIVKLFWPMVLITFLLWASEQPGGLEPALIWIAIGIQAAVLIYYSGYLSGIGE